MIRALLAAFVLYGTLPAVADDKVSYDHNGIRIIGRELPAGVYFDIDIVSAEKGAAAAEAALDILMQNSAYNREAIEKLKSAGRVVVLYDPEFPKREFDKVTIAAYLPDYYNPEAGNRDFVVVVGRFGAKWTPRDLAPVMAHELTGHGMQDYRGRIEHVRVVDLECEAYLYQEKAYQDLGFEKDTREMISFRQQLERHWCADFRTWQRANKPNGVKYWERLNPDVPNILKDYLVYLDALRTSGVSTRAVAAARQEIDAATNQRLQRLKNSDKPADHFRLAMTLSRGIGVPKNQVEAVKWLRKAAEAGHAEAQFQLSRAYWKGEGVGSDPEKAATWAKAAAEQGNPGASYTYGAMLINGQGVERNKEDGIAWLQKADKLGVEAAKEALKKLGEN